ncbi:MAG TPA: hypothetical protein VJT31_22785 [Rugosimonospora sp.]|nr:hypothetical protein [Rugosimonospora sp.]
MTITRPDELLNHRTRAEDPAVQRHWQSMNRTGQLLCAWLGPTMIVLFLIGSVWLAEYFPPAIHPSYSAQRVADFYAAHATRIRIGLVFTCCAYGVMGTWGVAMAVQTRRKEGIFPVLTYVQLTGMATGTAQIVVMAGIWAGAAFRPGQVSPEITQTLNDVGWMLLLGTWIPFTIWNAALGLAILLDRTDTPVFPRWSGYLSIWAGIVYIAGSGAWFFKHGPFSWIGLIALWVVFIVFGIWVMTFTILSMRNVRRGHVHEQEPALAAA